jgi:hypothetical protein
MSARSVAQGKLNGDLDITHRSTYAYVSSDEVRSMQVVSLFCLPFSRQHGMAMSKYLEAWSYPLSSRSS